MSTSERDSAGTSAVTRADVLVAFAAFAISASTAALGATRTGEAPFTAAAAVVLAAESAALVMRRRHPLITWLAVGTIAAIYGIVDWADPIIPLPAIVALASVFEWCRRRTAVIVLTITAVVAVIATAMPSDSDALDWGVVVLTLVVSPVIGDLLRARREELDAMAARHAALEAAQAEAVEAARVAERQRIARELHDVVTHNVTMLVVQAEAGASTPTMTDDDRIAAFDALADGGRAALVELRQLLGVLRDPGDATPSAPASGIAQVDELIGRARRAGLDVEYQGPESVAELPAAVDLAAYRVVQEGLTNVVRHAAARRAVVSVVVEPDTVVITVDDDGVGNGSDHRIDGIGLAGLRERIRLLGGSVDAAPRPFGGFRLSTRIPLGSAS
jgi:signal transduction histidine kinase